VQIDASLMVNLVVEVKMRSGETRSEEASPVLEQRPRSCIMTPYTSGRDCASLKDPLFVNQMKLLFYSGVWQ
jgi:hypothetical protein